MPTIGNVILVSRVLSYVLDKYFHAHGADMREKVRSAEAELGPDLAQDLTKIAHAAEAARHRSTSGSSEEFEATVDRAWRGLRRRRPEAELDQVSDTEPMDPVDASESERAARAEAEASSANSWMLIALVMFFIVVAMSSVHR